MRSKAFFFITSFLFFTLPFFSVHSGFNGGGDDPTFPEEDAGITSYTKLENVDSENNQEILTKINDFLANSGTVEETESGKYVMGTLKIEMKNENDEVIFGIYPHIYADANGWLAAYFPKDVPASKIIQWNDYSPEEGLSPDVLREAVTKTAEHLEKDYDKPRYYHFAHPGANRLTVVTDTVYNPEREDGEFAKTNFSVTFPEKGIKEASYSIYYSRELGSVQQCTTELLVGEKVVHDKSSSWCRGDEFVYSPFEKNGDIPFSPGNQHTVTFKARGGTDSTDVRFGVGSVFVYSEDE